MPIKGVQRKVERTAKELDRIKAIREKFQKEKPTLEQLLATGDYAAPVPLGVYLETRSLLQELRRQREGAGLSLADVAERSGMDKAAVSRLESGKQENFTVETLMRYARAIGKQVVWSFVDAPAPGNY